MRDACKGFGSRVHVKGVHCRLELFEWRGPRREAVFSMQLVGTSSSGFVYSDTGGDGPAVVLLHGVLMSGTLWDDVVDRLRGRYRCIVPELPFVL